MSCDCTPHGFSTAATATTSTTTRATPCRMTTICASTLRRRPAIASRRAPIGASGLKTASIPSWAMMSAMIERAAEDAEVDRLIDEESGEGDVAGHRGGENDQRGRPAERSQRSPGLVLRRSLRAGRLRPELAHRIGDRDRGQKRAHAPRGDRDVERGGRVGGRLDQTLDGPDRRNRHREAIEDPRRTVADRNEAPGRAPRREQAAAKRIDGDQDARRLEAPRR